MKAVMGNLASKEDFNQLQQSINFLQKIITMKPDKKDFTTFMDLQQAELKKFTTSLNHLIEFKGSAEIGLKEFKKEQTEIAEKLDNIVKKV